MLVALLLRDQESDDCLLLRDQESEAFDARELSYPLVFQMTQHCLDFRNRLPRFSQIVPRLPHLKGQVLLLLPSKGASG